MHVNYLKAIYKTSIFISDIKELLQNAPRNAPIDKKAHEILSNTISDLGCLINWLRYNMKA